MKKTQIQSNSLAVLLLAVWLLFGTAGLLTPAPALAAKAKPQPEQTIGYVNRQQVFASYPGIQDLMNRVQTMRTEAQKDYDARSKDLTDAERRALSDTLSREQAQKEDALMQPVAEKIEASIQAVAEEKGLTAIIDSGVMVYGGVDITADVIAKLKQ